jgi:lipid II:glycine glycyltransferase (peptidoglycan interpeptide bridge formation enzyme)
MAGTIILIQMILDAKIKGLKYYDFWGITTSEDKNHPWYGFTQYKKSFGGFERDYSGTYDLPLNKAKYSLYKKLRVINRKLRKM